MGGGKREQSHLEVGLGLGRFVSNIQQRLLKESLLCLGVWPWPPEENENGHNTRTCVECCKRRMRRGARTSLGVFAVWLFLSWTWGSVWS